MRKVADSLFKQWATGIADHGFGGCEKLLEHDRTSRGMNTSPTVQEGIYVLYKVPRNRTSMGRLRSTPHFCGRHIRDPQPHSGGQQAVLRTLPAPTPVPELEHARSAAVISARPLVQRHQSRPAGLP